MAAIQGQPPVWDDFLAGYAAGVDTPFSTCWRELAAAYPDAPVLLSHRGSAEVWHRSMDVTVLARTRDMLAMDGDVNPMVPLFRAMFDDVFADPDDPADVIAGYERRLAQVRAEIEPERLVEWRPVDGWEPICRALGVPVPDRPLPHENTTCFVYGGIAEVLALTAILLGWQGTERLAAEMLLLALMVAIGLSAWTFLLRITTRVQVETERK